MRKWIIIAMVLVASLLVAPSSAWLSGYTYRQEISVTGYSAWSANQTNYTIMLSINNTVGTGLNSTGYTNGHSQPDWSDIRFTSTSDTEYSYWIEYIGTNFTNVWVEIPEIVNSSTTITSLYMYYGNVLATSASDGDNTFLVHSNKSDAGEWSTGTGVSVTSAGDYLYFVISGTRASTRTMGINQPWCIETSLYRVASSNSNIYIISGVGSGTTIANPRDTQAYCDPSSTNLNAYYSGAGHLIYNSYSIGSTYQYIHKFVKNASTDYDYYLYNSSRIGYLGSQSGTYALTVGVNPLPAFQIASGSGLWSSYVYMEWMFARKYAEPEPAVIGWGAEEYAYTYIDFDKDAYASGENAIINTTFTTMFWDTVNYTYSCSIYRYPDLSTPITTYFINQQTYEKTIDTSSLGVGIYYGMLYLTDTATGITYFIDYDSASVVNGITLSGIVFNATSGASLVGASVDISQAGSTTTYVSDVSGYTTTSPLNVGQEINVTGYMSGYTTNSHSFTPVGASNITYAIPLVPSDMEVFYNWTLNGTSIGGLVTEMPYYAPASLAYVNLSNATWYSNITVGMPGYYQFDGLDNTTDYTLLSGKASFSDYTTNVTTGIYNYTWHNFTLGSSFSLTVYVKDASSGAPITSNVTIEITNSTGSTYSDTTTTGYSTFASVAGGWDISASCIGYVAGTSYVTMDSDKSVTILLSQPTVSNVYYTPHDVKMVVQDAYGNPIDGATMTITPISTTLDSWDWLQSVLGVPEAAAADTTVQTGTTDYMGSATFVLVKEIQYKIDVVSAADSVDETYYLYPKDDMYIFTVGVAGGYEDPTNPVTNMTWSFTNTTVNATHENITFTYSDSGNTTTNVSFWVKSHSSPVTVVYQTYCTNPNGCSAYYVASASNGEEYYVGATVTCVDGSCYNLTQAFQFQKLVNLGISSAYYPWIAAAFLIVIGAIFSVISVRFGAILIPMFAWMFFYMKWLTLTWQQTALLTILLVIGIFAYVRKQEDKVGG